MPTRAFLPDLINSLPALPSLLDVVCKATGSRLAVVAQVVGNHWMACSVRDEENFGISVGDILPLEVTPCFEVRERGETVVIRDVTADPVRNGNPVLKNGRFRSYLASPIVLSNGQFFGTLCALDRRPALLDRPETISMFQLLAQLTASQIDHSDVFLSKTDELRSATARLDVSEIGRHHAENQLAVSTAELVAANVRLDVSDAALLDAQATANLREQFVAILGHDLRNPVGALSSGLSLLSRSSLDGRSTKIIGMMRQSVGRMNELVVNMLDFARMGLGGGITIDRSEEDLEPVLKQVISEVELRFPDRNVATRFDLVQPVSCDPARIGQLFSNLLGNAITHGAADLPVQVQATTHEGVFTLSVTNGGGQIPPETLSALFKPFVRGDAESQEGLGLGLFIAAGIAQAHGGTLTATSSPQETRFTLEIPSHLDFPINGISE